MKADKLAMILGAVVIVFLTFAVVSKAGIIGVSRDNLEGEARKSLQLDSSWGMAQDIGDELCAMLFYDSERTQFKYSVYMKGESLSYGYFVWEEGAYPFEEDSVHGFLYEEKAIALLSPNRDEIEKIVAGDQEIHVNPLNPFVLVLPVDCGEITIYDVVGDVVAMYDTYTG